MSPFDPSTEWTVVAPGVIELPTTGITIQLMSDWSIGHRYQVMWNHREISRTATLDFAKLEAQKWLTDLQELGFYRG
jgi:hypothetical protein